MNEITTLKEIEIRIREHMTGIGLHMIEVGRCLNEAKDICPHGEWEGWVLRNTGMKLRTAQELMKVAREVPQGSAMERLNISMVSKILTLPEGQREAVAEKAESENMTVRTLRSMVDALKLDKDTLRERLQQQVENTGKMNEARALAEQQVENLKKMLRAEQEKAPQVVSDPEQAARIEALNAELQAAREDLERAEEDAERFSDEAQNARAQLINYQMSGGGCDDKRTMVADIVKAVQQFMAAAGVFPQMQDRVAALGDAERNELRMYISEIAEWANTGLKLVNSCRVIEITERRA